MKITLFATLILSTLVASSVSQICQSDEFECANGRCIPEYYQCDGDDDCEDGSDEPTNPSLCPACHSHQFRCDNGRCVHTYEVCDFYNDCRDGSDERQNCTTSCPEGMFHCAIGGCIREDWVCDGDNDCYDWSDESVEVCTVTSTQPPKNSKLQSFKHIRVGNGNAKAIQRKREMAKRLMKRH